MWGLIRMKHQPANLSPGVKDNRSHTGRMETSNARCTSKSTVIVLELCPP